MTNEKRQTPTAATVEVRKMNYVKQVHPQHYPIKHWSNRQTPIHAWAVFFTSDKSDKTNLKFCIRVQKILQGGNDTFVTHGTSHLLRGRALAPVEVEEVAEHDC